MLDVGIDVSFPVGSAAGSNKNRDYSFANTDWKETIIKAGKKWPLPIECLADSANSFIKIAPIFQ
jgi:hypothetical protein